MKYYVSTGDSNVVLVADTHKEAAVKVLKHMIDLRDYDFGQVTQVGEKGFDKIFCETACFFSTETLLLEAFA